MHALARRRISSCTLPYLRGRLFRAQSFREELEMRLNYRPPVVLFFGGLSESVPESNSVGVII
jgi:hypothetical protein